MKLRLRNLTSIFLAVVMILTAVCALTSVSAIEGETITYKYTINCDSSVHAFDGKVIFPDALSVNSVIVYNGNSSAYHAVRGNKIVFNATNVSSPFDFSNGEAIITVEFAVHDTYDKSAIYTTLDEFYSMDVISTGNISYRYKNIVDDEIITSGFVNIDNPSESYTDPTTEPETTEPETTTAPESTTVEPEETTTVPEETTTAPEETTEPEESTPVPEETTTAPEETTEPEETTTAPEETTIPSETTYTVVYNYNNGKEDTSIVKTFKTSEEMSAMEIANTCFPTIESPYYTYSIESASVEGSTVTVQLKSTQKMYDVTLDGEDYSSRPYLYVETITVPEETGFILDGKVVAVGTEFKFFVTGDMDITTDSSKSETDEFATINFNSLRASDDNVYMEMIASAKVNSYSRMGVAFKTTEYTDDDVKAAVNEVTSGTRKASNGIAVHNSSVTKMNSSGQYQYLYVPYLSTSLINQDMKIYFCSYVVKGDGTILLSEPQEVKPYNAIA